MSAKTIAVVGVTGNQVSPPHRPPSHHLISFLTWYQGGSVASLFSTLPEWHVRGITRDPSKPSAASLKDQGIDLVAADLDDVPSLKKAFEGAAVVFGVTDFWQHVQNPANHAVAASRNVTINEIAYENEVKQGRNIVDAAAATSGLERFVLGTINSTKKLSGGKITFNLHFDAKWEAVDYCKEKYPELWEKTSLLQLGMFASNWKSGLGGPKKGEDGKFTMQMALSGDKKVPQVDVNKDTGRFVQALLAIPPKVNMMGAGSLISWNEYLAIWSRVNKVHVEYQQIDRAALEQMLGTVGREFADMFQYIEEFGYDGGDPDVVYPWEVKEKYGVDVKYTTMEEYIKGEDWSSVL